MDTRAVLTSYRKHTCQTRRNDPPRLPDHATDPFRSFFLGTTAINNVVPLEEPQESAGPSSDSCRSGPSASVFVRPAKEVSLTPAPHDWSDISGWDHYHEARACDGPFGIPTDIGAEGWRSVRFLKFVKDRGGRVWFPGCGTDPGPRFYAYVGCSVLATDFSLACIKVQERFARLPPEGMFVDWVSFVNRNAAYRKPGVFDVAEDDFTVTRPPDVFDVVINCLAFQGLTPSAMNAAARSFFNALRPGGAAMIDTINVQGKTLRNGIENSLMEAGSMCHSALPSGGTATNSRAQASSIAWSWADRIFPEGASTRPSTLRSTPSAIN